MAPNNGLADRMTLDRDHTIAFSESGGHGGRAGHDGGDHGGGFFDADVVTDLLLACLLVGEGGWRHHDGPDLPVPADIQGHRLAVALRDGLEQLAPGCDVPIIDAHDAIAD